MQSWVKLLQSYGRLIIVNDKPLDDKVNTNMASKCKMNAEMCISRISMTITCENKVSSYHKGNISLELHRAADTGQEHWFHRDKYSQIPFQKHL